MRQGCFGGMRFLSRGYRRAGNRRLSVVRAVHEPTRSESKGEPMVAGEAAEPRPESRLAPESTFAGPA